MTKRKSKKSSKKISRNDKYINNNKNNNKNELYNYICIGVVFIIIIYFICKEQLNEKEGFEESSPEKQKIKNELNSYNDIYKKIVSNLNHMLTTYQILDTEEKYNTFHNNFNKVNDDFKILKEKNIYIISLITKNSNLITSNQKVMVESNLDSLETKIEDFIKYINTNIIIEIEEQKQFNNMVIGDDYIEFNLSVPAKMHLRENTASIFYVYLRHGEDEIYGPVILISDNQYKLLDINSTTKYYSSKENIKIKIEDIANELFKKTKEIIVNVTDNEKSNKIHLYGVDQNDTTAIFNKKIDGIHSPLVGVLVSKLNTLKENKIKEYQDALNKSNNNYYIKELKSLTDRYNTLDIYGIPKIPENIDIDSDIDSNSSFRKELNSDVSYKNIKTYYQQLNTENNSDIKDLQKKHKELKTNEEKCITVFKTYNKKLDNIMAKFKKRKNAITKNQYKPFDKNAIRILGNNTTHFQDGIIDVGVFSLNVD
jgi:hypothetical protein